MRESDPLAALEAEGLLRREGDRLRTTRRWQGAMARAAFRLVGAGMVMPRFASGLEESSFQVLADLGLEYGTFDEPVDVGKLLP